MKPTNDCIVIDAENNNHNHLGDHRSSTITTMMLDSKKDCEINDINKLQQQQQDTHLFPYTGDKSSLTSVLNEKSNQMNHFVVGHHHNHPHHHHHRMAKMDFDDGYCSGRCYGDGQTTRTMTTVTASTTTTTTKGSLNKMANFISDNSTYSALLIMSVIIVLLTVWSFICLAQHYRQEKICLTQVCVTESAKIIRSLDETVDPCEDFYQFVCGQWLEATIIPEHKPMENKFDELHDILNRQVRAILEEPSGDSDPDFVRNMKRFYRSCMNITEIEQKGSKPLIDIIEKLGGWPVLEDPDQWTEDSEQNWTLIDIHRRLNEIGVIDDMLIPLIITSYDKNNSRNVLAIKEPSFGLMNREFMVKDIKDTAVKSYFSLMLYSVELLLEQKLLQLNEEGLGLENSFDSIDLIDNNSKESGQTRRYNQKMGNTIRDFTFEMDDIHLEPRIIEEMRQVLNFERMLAENSIKKEERGNVSQLFNNMTIEQLQKISPNIEWLELINVFNLDKQKMTKESEIVVIDLNYVKFLSEIIPKTSKRLLANYIVWRVVKSKIGVLDSTWRRLKQTYNAVNLGHPKIEPRWMQCVAHTHATLGTALSNVYVKNYFSIKEKNKIDEIVWQIRAELNETISKADWMDPETRQQALDKLEMMNFRIGFPDEILDDRLVSKFYENLTLSDDYFENLIAIHKFEVENAFKSLDEINSRNDWRKYSEVVDVNAYYFHQENSFILNAGILQNRFFNPDRPNYLNYGSIGEIIGHEITHGFDSIGKQFDKSGQLRNWWRPITDRMYEERASCMVNQYDKYYFKQIDMHLNGQHTKDENIADNLGVQLAYRAYKRSHQHQSQPEPYLPGLQYNPRQLFWISYGLENCEKMTDEMLKLTLQVDTHAPGQYRLNGVVSNSKYFSEDFYCPKDSPMNPKVKCQVW